MPQTALILLIPLLPLLGFLILGLFSRRISGPVSAGIATTFIAGSTALAIILTHGYFFEWGSDDSGFRQIRALDIPWLVFDRDLRIDMGALVDPISVMMLLVISVVSLMVHVYSSSYLKGEARMPVYYAFLGLFTFSMMGLVLSANLFQIYIFWELVGVSSFLLIGYYYQKPSAVAAAKKAFIVTRFADLGFLIGILVLGYEARSLDFLTLIERLTSVDDPDFHALIAPSFLGCSAITWGLALVFMGGMGKSAMFPLHIWLPDAMEGPTPVSALIHAATMVVAGVFLLARLFPVYAIAAPDLLTWITGIGIFSALFAAIIATTQTDIKRVLAYSTMSQIGFMMFSLGVSGQGGEAGLGYMASQFHLFTHAFFKALLFLGAGSVIHAVHSNEMADMGGLRKQLPVTHLTFLIACLAIAGIPPFSGFFSKEEILMATSKRSVLLFGAALFTSGLTAFYMFRLYFRIFWNHPAGEDHGHGEGGTAMVLPLTILAVATVLSGFIPFGHFVTSDLKPLETHLHPAFSIAPVVIAVLGILLAARFHKNASDRAERFAVSLRGLYTAAKHRFYIDEVYLFITKRILFNGIGKPAAWFDRQVVDGLVNGAGTATLALSHKIRGLQSGKVQQYALIFLVAVILLALAAIYRWT
jgi:NADH-quinone oxidoreductase subunit L